MPPFVLGPHWCLPGTPGHITCFLLPHVAQPWPLQAHALSSWSSSKSFVQHHPFPLCSGEIGRLLGNFSSDSVRELLLRCDTPGSFSASDLMEPTIEWQVSQQQSGYCISKYIFGSYFWSPRKIQLIILAQELNLTFRFVWIVLPLEKVSLGSRNMELCSWFWRLGD